MKTEQEFIYANPQFAERAGMPHASERLEAGHEYLISASEPLAHDEQYGDILAVITAGKTNREEADSFVLVDVKDNPKVMVRGREYSVFGADILDSSVHYVLVGGNYGEPGKAGLKGLRPGESFILGRDQAGATDRFELNHRTSRNHFQIRCSEEGNVFIQDLASLNGTEVTMGVFGTRHNEREQEAPHQDNNQERPQPEPKLGQEMEHKFSELTQLFGTEIQQGVIDASMISGILHEIEVFRNSGIDENKIYKRMAQRVHPDKFPAGSSEHERMSALAKVVNIALNR